MLQPGDLVEITREFGFPCEIFGIYLGSRITKWSDEYVIILVFTGDQVEEVAFRFDDPRMHIEVHG